MSSARSRAPSRDSYGDAVESERGVSLGDKVVVAVAPGGGPFGELLAKRAKNVTLVSGAPTSVSGSSKYFVGGAVVYSNELKSGFAHVPAELIDRHGDVREEVAITLAEGIRAHCSAGYGIGITGIAGPTGGTAEKPVGLVFHAVADGGETEMVERKFPGDRERVRLWASQQALDMLRRKLIS